ncbi:MAG: MoxR family ATPase [Candidatus Altiarchaeota archaeon]|nr:MoxR family ATPase [Candidatus Altiarchaeota archaeon]
MSSNAKLLYNGLKKHVYGNPEIVEVFTAGVLSKSNILLQGSHGKGKTLLSKVIAKLAGVHYTRIQGSPDLRGSHYIGRIKLDKLSLGIEEVEWKDIATKTTILHIDEINRISPVEQNNFFSIIAEQLACYNGQTKETPEMTVVATMNPADEGTFQLTPPFLDRFHISLPVQSRELHDKRQILESHVTNEEIKPVLKDGELQEMWSEVRNVEVPEDIAKHVLRINRDLQLCMPNRNKNLDECESVEKEFLHNFPAICASCNNHEWICSKVKNSSAISERLTLHVIDVAQGLAFLHARSKVNLDDVKLVLHYALNHRIQLTEAKMQDFFTPSEALGWLTEQLDVKEKQRHTAYKLLDGLQNNYTEKAMLEFSEYARQDMLLQEVKRNLKKVTDSKAQSVLEQIGKTDSVEELVSLKKKLESGELKVPNASEVLSKLADKIVEMQTLTATFTPDEFMKFKAKVARVCPKLGKAISENPSLTAYKSEDGQMSYKNGNMTFLSYTTESRKQASQLIQQLGGETHARLKTRV